MKYLGTAMSLTLGAWRLRIRIDLEDEPDCTVTPPGVVHQQPPRLRERA